MKINLNNLNEKVSSAAKDLGTAVDATAKKAKEIGVDASKVAKDVAGKTKDIAVLKIDQNGDGVLDAADVALLTGSIGNAVKSGIAIAKENAVDFAKQRERKALQPFFLDELDSVEFALPKFIHVADRDQKYRNSSVCQGSIGYRSNQKGIPAISLFRDCLDIYGLTFFPDSDGEFFYLDPCDRDVYINLEDYFSYIRKRKVSELQKIAQDLGAKHFKVTYRNEETSFFVQKGSVDVKAGIVKADANAERRDNKNSKMEIAAEMFFIGHEPMRPVLKYMQREPEIQNLIEMRMANNAPLSQKYSFKMSNSSGIRENEAVKIDTVIKGLKCSAKESIVKEAKNESRKCLDYEIDF